MKQFIRLFVIFVALLCVLLLTGCAPIDRSAWSSPGYYDVYDGYGYPHGYGYGGYPYQYNRSRMGRPVGMPRGGRR
ncbi:MAG: hypothetical protein HN366_00535 [Deltaproteobacteria bacterium]|nr:hypothetical protein [Deltaproteobacteria bacterium]